ncbi:MAG: hypothetical protein IPI24_02640 [Ignavibacteria bacterium]|nr:hypothetical protein [Ignavibacteria bacterium]MBK6418819.1 hypothetical protein [Ignavibacteria bacterium]MBK7576313.1 hypothetical protein [Ignavibacteria bacterium]
MSKSAKIFWCQAVYPRLDRVRDLFLLECYTGLWVRVVQAMHCDDICVGVWCLCQQKTKAEVRIHISSRAEAIINTYRSVGSPAPIDQFAEP